MARGIWKSTAQKKKNEKQIEHKTEKEPLWFGDAQKHEDAALKMGMQYFAEDLLPYLGIEGKVQRIAPTEAITLNIYRGMADFNEVMKEGDWKHFEFQSTNGGLEDLKRFRAYEAVLSFQHKVSVTTYVLFSGKIQNPMSSFTEGVNTYRVVPIVMKEKNADEVLKALHEKVKKKELLTKEDRSSLILLALMDGTISQKERFLQAFSIMEQIGKEVETSEQEELRQIEAILYTMADKFLEKAELREIEEVIAMTELGKMLFEHGVERGLQRGLQKGGQQKMMELVKRKLSKGQTEAEIAEALEESVPVIHELIEEINRE